MRKLPFLLLAVFLLAPAALPGAVCVPTSNGQWSTQGPLPTNQVRAWGAYFPGDGKFYALGGRQTDTAGSDLLNPRQFDPASGTWSTRMAVFPDNQVNNMVGGVLNEGGTDYIFVVGGSAAGATTATNTVKRYDPIADQLTVVASDPWPGNPTNNVLPGGAAVLGNKLYVFGGFTINVGMTTEIWEFDPNAAPGARWTEKTAVLPGARGYIPAATAGSFIYLFGGSSWDGVTLVDSNQSLRYDPLMDFVSAVATIPRATAETRAVTQADGTIWVLGGGRTAPNPGNQVDVYDPVGNSWTTAEPLPTARRNFAADSNPVTGTVWAAGGYATDGVTPLNVTEVFTCELFLDGFETGDTSRWSFQVP